MWYLKHKPSSFEEFLGNGLAIKELRTWLINWKTSRNKAVLLLGPTGSGKTTAVELLAKESKRNLIETNASDVRKKADLEMLFGKSLQQQSLFHQGKIVLFDEIEGISGMYDRGASSAIIEVIKNTKHPIIMTASNPKDKNVKKLRRHCDVIKFAPIGNDEIYKGLERILSKEKIPFDGKSLRRVARSGGGDIRAAINNLESVVINGKVSPEDAESISDRDVEKDAEEVAKIIFKASSPEILEQVMMQSSANLDTMMQFVRENIPRNYKNPQEVADAMNMISRSDVFRGRISRRDYYRYMVYQNKLMSIGVSTAKKGKIDGEVHAHYPMKISKLAASMFSRASDNRNAAAIGNAVHSSKIEARKYFPLLKRMKAKQPSKYRKIEEKLDISF